MSGENFPKRGEIYWVLEPTRGSEIKKKRPGLVVSNDIGNEFSRVVMIAPITSKVKNVYPFEVKVVVEKKNAKIMLNQSRAVDKERLLNKIGVVGQDTMKDVDTALKIVFALD